MKHTSLLSILIFFATSTFCQNCKFKVDNTDPITGKKTQIIVVKNNYAGTILYSRQGDDFYIDADINISGDHRYILPEGSVIEIKLNNDSIFTLFTTAIVAPKVATSKGGPNGTIVTSYNKLNFRLNNNLAHNLTIYGIKFCRVHLEGNETSDLYFKDKEIEKSKEAANCIFK